MARARNRLNVKKIPSLPTGFHADGEGLYLRVDDKGGRRWVFVFVRHQRRREMGLGRFPDRSLSDARADAEAARRVLADGGDPISMRQAAKAATLSIPTFGAFADDYIATHEDGWKSAVHRNQWRSSLRDHAKAIRGKPINEIATDDILTVLRPIWLDKPETARRVRGRIERILDAAKVKGHRSGDNPAAWRGHLKHLLADQKEAEQKEHHAALAYADAPAFFASLADRPAKAARALEFLILTAARSGEVLGATWREIDFEGRLWTVPAERMKAGREHIVPLSDAALAALERVRPGKVRADNPIFGDAGTALSNMSMSMLLRRMGQGGITVHGFRSTFRDFAGDETSHPHDVIEMAMAHTIKNKAEAAYRRKSAVEKRRLLMQDWADYLTGKANEASAASDDPLADALAALKDGRALSESARATIMAALIGEGSSPPPAENVVSIETARAG